MATVFPQAISLAATFDEDFIEKVADAISTEGRAKFNMQQEYDDAVVSKQDLYETYLPAFKACVKEAKVEAVMGAYNRTNGDPCCGNKMLLQDILRKEWGFKGHVVSDCWAIKDFHNGHGVTGGPLESVAMAMNNGCDLNCGELFLYVAEAVKQGMVSEERLDEALVNLFTARMKLGVFDGKGSTPFDDIPYTAVDSREMRALNLEAAEKCITLLKNEDHLLPPDKLKIKTIGIIGPNADNRKALVGNYEGTASRYCTISEGIQDYVGNDVRVLVSEGCHLYKESICNLSKGSDRVSEVKGICAESDVVVLCLGLDSGLEGEEGDEGNQYASGDKPSLNLPGRLPVTFYRSLEELPEFTDYNMKGRTYHYMKNEALYPFGYGLSYTSFTYSNPAVSADVVNEDGITVSAVLTNDGQYEGTETVQVYVKADREGTPNV